jgi:hypothetical protein
VYTHVSLIGQGLTPQVPRSAGACLQSGPKPVFPEETCRMRVCLSGEEERSSHVILTG